MAYVEPWHRRMRAVFAGETVLDSSGGKLLYETDSLPLHYYPLADLREDFLVPAEPGRRRLNQFDHFRARLDETHIHFVHQRARHGRGIPLILTHGWPSSFVEYLPLVPLLTDPQAHGIDGPAFDVVIPSLPGYGFSQRPARTGVHYHHVADLWHRLMQGLGYQRYGAGDEPSPRT